MVTDANGCTVTNNVTLNQPTALTASAAATSNFNGFNISCNGGANGAASAAGAGGVGPYTYAWNNGATSTSVSGLAAGNYTISITDANGCNKVVSLALIEPTPITSSYEIGIVSCYKMQDGWAIVNINGGAGNNYTVQWNNGSSGANLQGLRAGWYNYLVTDKNSCSHRDSILITQPDAIVVDWDTVRSTCIRSFDGELNVIAYGGNGEFRYYLNEIEFSGYAQGLGTSNIFIRVLDAKGCDTIFQLAMPPLNDPCIFIPNWFSPNGNGEQDLWMIRGIEYEKLKVQVFNVHGQLLYTSSSYDYTPWDGTFQGKEMPAGDYYYVIESFGIGDNYTGHVTILR